mmetsp:Transcript_780/g.2343  ORF Transcript_780/g.2343 Transcript_780/m.2343 type:complete len:388 (-) Transcript_780:1974-3137(-)
MALLLTFFQPSHDIDVLIPSSCPCHGCNETIIRADVNRGNEKSLTYNFVPRTSEWKAEPSRYRYKRDTELVIGCTGRHRIIESPKAGRYAQLWCRTCCNCEATGRPIGNLVGCANAAHWHTVTNRSYHEKTPFHQLANNLLQSSYNEALQSGMPFEKAIGPIGIAYYRNGIDQRGIETSKTKYIPEKPLQTSLFSAEALGGHSHLFSDHLENRIGMKRDRGIFDAEIAMTPNAMLTPPLYYFDNKTCQWKINSASDLRRQFAYESPFGASRSRSHPIRGSSMAISAMPQMSVADLGSSSIMASGFPSKALASPIQRPFPGSNAELSMLGGSFSLTEGIASSINGLSGKGQSTARQAESCPFLEEPKGNLWDLPDILTTGGRVSGSCF